MIVVPGIAAIDRTWSHDDLHDCCSPVLGRTTIFTTAMRCRPLMSSTKSAPSAPHSDQLIGVESAMPVPIMERYECSTTTSRSGEFAEWLLQRPDDRRRLTTVGWCSCDLFRGERSSPTGPRYWG